MTSKEAVDKFVEIGKKKMAKKTTMRSESHTYDSNRPKRQVVSRYK